MVLEIRVVGKSCKYIKRLVLNIWYMFFMKLNINTYIEREDKIYNI